MITGIPYYHTTSLNRVYVHNICNGYIRCLNSSIGSQRVMYVPMNISSNSLVMLEVTKQKLNPIETVCFLDKVRYTIWFNGRLLCNKEKTIFTKTQLSDYIERNIFSTTMSEIKFGNRTLYIGNSVIMDNKLNVLIALCTELTFAEDGKKFNERRDVTLISDKVIDMRKGILRDILVNIERFGSPKTILPYEQINRIYCKTLKK